MPLRSCLFGHWPIHVRQHSDTEHACSRPRTGPDPMLFKPILSGKSFLEIVGPGPVMSKAGSLNPLRTRSSSAVTRSWSFCSKF